MKKFFRSLRYLRPYRVRLGIACVCVVLIALLWASGLAGILPGAKILISQEGLHGWAWDSMLQDRLDVRTVRRNVEGTDGLPAVLIDILEVGEDGPSAKAGLAPGRRLVGIGDSQRVAARRQPEGSREAPRATGGVGGPGRDGPTVDVRPEDGADRRFRRQAGRGEVHLSPSGVDGA